jgi:branched-chain amino acid transport system permease protein
VLIMVILGGMGHFWGPAIGAAALILLNQQISAYTQFWPFVLGVTLIVLLFVFPGGIVGTVAAGWKRVHGRDGRGWRGRRS